MIPYNAGQDGFCFKSVAQPRVNRFNSILESPSRDS